MRRLASVMLVAAVAVTGCGANDADSTDAVAPAATATSQTAPATTGAGAPSTTGSISSGAETSTSAREVAGIVPDAQVTEVTSGDTVRLRAVMATDRPTLIWMWAPH